MKNIPYTCAICGKPCEGRINARYCPECRENVKRSTQRESKAKAARRRCKDPPAEKPTLGQIAAKARRLHMSYGEFVARYGL